MGVIMAYAACFRCRQLFFFNPELVPSIPIGPDGQPATESGLISF